MIYNLIAIFISIFFEGLFNLIFDSSSYFLPLFTVLSLIFIYPYYYNSRKDYIIFSCIIGLIYDLVFTNFYILNILLFLIISNIIFIYMKWQKYNYINILVISIVIITVYQFLLWMIFNVMGYSPYDFNELLYILKHFYIINLIYVSLVFVFSRKFIRIN